MKTRIAPINPSVADPTHASTRLSRSLSMASLTRCTTEKILDYMETLMIQKSALLMLAVLIVGISEKAYGWEQLGPTPYTSFAASSPFAGGAFSYFILSDFESADPGDLVHDGDNVIGIVIGGTPSVDSVDEDDGAVDNVCSDCRSLFYSDNNGHAGITFNFYAHNFAEGLPTHVGIVWTDGTPPITFTATGPGGPFSATFAPPGGEGVIEEDTFIGVFNADGISW